jgi:NAD(P)-dependent dehydrogenase (short-subunit alcohol dehydrogenase family)
MGNLLVVGARAGSLGACVADVAEDRGWAVTTAGVSGDENIDFDITNYTEVEMLLEESPARHVIVCTAGINYEGSIRDEQFYGQLDDTMRTNAVGPLHLLHRWQAWWMNNIENEGASADTPNTPLHFVAISSNSAHIARSQSLAYCASKAALSMGIRCAARELADTWLNVWGVEPGWLSGTPMSKEVNARFEYGVPRHRIPGDRTVDPAALAHFIVGGLRNPYSSLNGCMIRMDGGEQ